MSDFFEFEIVATIGHKYLIRYLEPGKRTLRESVVRFLDQDETQLFFDGRPLVGTLSVPRSWLVSMVSVGESTEITINQKVRTGAYTSEVSRDTRPVLVDDEVYRKVHKLALPGESVAETLHRVLIDEKCNESE